ncbi:MAG TPA: DegT/DnrJ/EryC1/StrS family aminotransferase, partial [Cellvibrionaceae bacterium]|nr:DegT/DnrJ/EryC1/StrS family aminotransferase [Cellvibrionaceae bacterium]
RWLDSGTSALALALLDAKAQRPLAAPEVIVPAYGCPDIVAACIYAGCTARLVDIRPKAWGYDLDQLRQALNANTLAVVGVNFLGIREDWQGILNVLNSWDTPISTIEDNAQWFPNLSSAETFYSDYLVFSFGKGKPVSLLGGGALFSRAPLNTTRLIRASAAKGFILKTQYALFNQLLKPSIYWFLNHNPIFKPGATAYTALEGIYSMDDSRLSLLPSNYAQYAHNADTVSAAIYATLCNLGRGDNLYSQLNTQNRKMLRFPLLCDTTEQRDELLNELTAQGLGATAMYQKALADLNCPPALIRVQQPQDNARNFADHFLTLPCHSGVTSQRLAQIKITLTKYF